MKTLEQVQNLYESKCLDGRDIDRLAQFIPELELLAFGLELQEEYVGKHKHIEFTKENILKQLKEDIEFGQKSKRI